MEPMAYTFRNGLARFAEGHPWQYQFRFRGKLYRGSTGLVARPDAVLWLRRYREQLANGEVGLATAPSLKAAWKHWHSTTKGKVSEAHRERAESAFRLHILPVAGEVRADPGHPLEGAHDWPRFLHEGEGLTS